MSDTEETRRAASLTLPGQPAERGVNRSPWVRRTKALASPINLLMIGATAFVVGRVLLLHRTELFSLGAEIGDVLNDAALAYAGAWFFQWLVIARPARRDRERLELLVAPRVDSLIGLGMEVAAVILRAAAQPLAWPVDRGSVASTWKLDPGTNPPGWLADWYVFLDDVANSAAADRAALKPFYSRLDHTLLELLEHEENKMQIVHRTVRAGQALGWKSLARWEDPLLNWLDAIEALRRHRLLDLAPAMVSPTIDLNRFDHFRAPVDVMSQIQQLAEREPTQDGS